MAQSRFDFDRHVVARLVRITDISPSELEIELNQVDRERAGRYRLKEDRKRFLAGRALLAALLARYLSLPAQGAELTYTEHGRPVLAGKPSLHFNISHSGDLVSVVLGVETQVGIDVEYMPRSLDLKALAERIFCADDLEKFRAGNPTDSRAAFFHAWTGKEAVLKARGLGLFGGLKEVSVSMPGAEQDIRLLNEPDGTVHGWRLQPLRLPADYAGHVAWDDPRKTLDWAEVRLSDLA